MPGFDVTGTSSLSFTTAGETRTAELTFTRTTAPLTTFATGFVTLTGPATVRLPVALRPVAVAAPAEVSGTVTTGSVPVTVTAGFTGDLAVQPAGLAAGTTVQKSLASGASFEQDVVVAAGTRFARFDVKAANKAGDFDLTVYRYNKDGTALVAVAGQSATGSADERVDLLDPAAGKYLVVVDNFANAPGETVGAFAATTFLVELATSVGNLTVTPNPVAMTQGEKSTFTASWSGLTSGTPYLGLLSYDEALAPTVLSVS